MTEQLTTICYKMINWPNLVKNLAIVLLLSQTERILLILEKYHTVYAYLLFYLLKDTALLKTKIICKRKHCLYSLWANDKQLMFTLYNLKWNTRMLNSSNKLRWIVYDLIKTWYCNELQLACVLIFMSTSSDRYMFLLYYQRHNMRLLQCHLIHQIL